MSNRFPSGCRSTYLGAADLAPGIAKNAVSDESASSGIVRKSPWSGVMPTILTLC